MKNKTYFFIAALCIGLCCILACKENTSVPNPLLSNNKKIVEVKTTQDSSIQDKIILKALKHLGKPYLAHTLDQSVDEKLVVRLDGFDCTTLVETVLAEARQPHDIHSHIQSTRYIDGVISDYASRIHYFTEWIYENQKKGIVKDVTPEIKCSEPYIFKANYMSKNPSKYMQLKNDLPLQKKIADMESKINAYKWHYIPKQKLHLCEKDIKHGDIIAITTNISGLETSHIGIAFWDKDTLRLLHASTDEKKVVISKKSMQQYLISHEKQTGVMVVRVVP